jgi:signal transduction histidine kinase
MEGIRRLVQEFRANTLLGVNLQGSEDELADIPDTQALALFHICQEALANIAKHSRARTISVTLWKAADRYLMEVADDGQGFDVEKMKLSIGHGLANMQTRARNVGGDVDFSSEPGAGTTILAWVPASDES